LKIKHDCIKEIVDLNLIKIKEEKTLFYKFNKIIGDIMYAAGDEYVSS
jgi:hypothetical protein